MQRASRGAVVWGVLFRSWLLSIAGGAVVGLVAGCGVAIADDDLDSKPAAVVAGLAFLGGLAGIVLGVVLGVVVALVAGATSVPYPGRAKAVSTTRLVASLSVVALIGWATGTTLDSGRVALVTTLAATLLAAAFSPLVIGWYVAEMEASTPTPATDES